MIIECTACSKKFSVPDSAIDINGRLVQCSSCGNKWTQYPIKIQNRIKKTNKPSNVQPKKIKSKKIIKKSPAPYSKEYMQQKWGSSINNYAIDKDLSKKTKKVSGLKKKDRKIEKKERPDIGFGFFNYIISISVISLFLLGILNFERSRLSRKFPAIEPYIDGFYETLENFKILIIDLVS